MIRRASPGVWLPSIALLACGKGGVNQNNPPPGATGHSLGGTVTGALGSSVTLWLSASANHSNPIAMNGPGPFVFDDPLEAGTAYSVTAQVQSIQLDSCVVSQGTGVMPDADVGNILVTCSTGDEIAADVEGLTGSVVASLNDTELLTISSNGYHAFATRIPNLGAYSIEVATQPATQTCFVERGQGNVSSSDNEVAHFLCLDKAAGAFAVGGRVTGLPQGESVSLSLNGGTPMLVSGNGAFQFPALLADLEAFVVTLAQIPVAAQCGIRGGEGHLLGGAYHDIQVVCLDLTEARNIPRNTFYFDRLHLVGAHHFEGLAFHVMHLVFSDLQIAGSVLTSDFTPPGGLTISSANASSLEGYVRLELTGNLAFGQEHEVSVQSGLFDPHGVAVLPSVARFIAHEEAVGLSHIDVLGPQLLDVNALLFVELEQWFVEGPGNIAVLALTPGSHTLELSAPLTGNTTYVVRARRPYNLPRSNATATRLLDKFSDVPFRTPALQLLAATAASGNPVNEVCLTFDAPLSPAAEVAGYYQVKGHTVTQVVVGGCNSDPATVHLTTAEPLVRCPANQPACIHITATSDVTDSTGLVPVAAGMARTFYSSNVGIGVEDLVVSNGTSLEVWFWNDVEETSAELLGNYGLSAGAITDAVRGDETSCSGPCDTCLELHRCVTLTWSAPLSPSTQRWLSVANVVDASGTCMHSAQPCALPAAGLALPFDPPSPFRLVNVYWVTGGQLHVELSDPPLEVAAEDLCNYASTALDLSAPGVTATLLGVGSNTIVLDNVQVKASYVGTAYDLTVNPPGTICANGAIVRDSDARALDTGPSDLVLVTASAMPEHSAPVAWQYPAYASGLDPARYVLDAAHHVAPAVRVVDGKATILLRARRADDAPFMLPVGANTLTVHAVRDHRRVVISDAQLAVSMP